MTIRSIIKSLLPRSLLEFRRGLLRDRIRKANKVRTIEDVFSEIYKKNTWGGANGEFFSGTGSVGLVADAYCDSVISFIKLHGIESVVDIVCGDFRIGKRISKTVSTYTGIDVVPELIDFNKNYYSQMGVQFMCIDATSSTLPEGDLCLVRQVFQHLSNQQILSVLENMSKFKFCIVTEHYPKLTDRFVSNKDKQHGADVRVYDNSAVVLDALPFCISPLFLLMSVDTNDYLVQPGETIKSFYFSGADIKSAPNSVTTSDDKQQKKSK